MYNLPIEAKFPAPAAEIPVEDPQVVTEDNVNDDVFLYQAAVENRPSTILEFPLQ